MLLASDYYYFKSRSSFVLKGGEKVKQYISVNKYPVALVKKEDYNALLLNFIDKKKCSTHNDARMCFYNLYKLNGFDKETGIFNANHFELL